MNSAPVRFGAIAAKPPLSTPGQRIGLLGGSFNPPHAAHLMISQTALRRLQLDRVWWIVTPGNPLKSHDGLAELNERVAACKTLAAADKRIEITSFETALGSPYTAATIAFLKRRAPATRFVWLMGADNLAQFHHWQHWRDIADTVPIAVIDRPGTHLRSLAGPAAHALRSAFVPEWRAAALAHQSPPAWTFVTGPLSSLSSTELRARADAAKLS
ncbi:MAG: nicotinate-nucleotide adenylyltransferase [Pseudomonadota bacterium]